MTTIKCIYNRNLKMSPAKLASQVGHVVANIALIPERIIVLKASKTKFDEKIDQLSSNTNFSDWHIQFDAGYTEVEKGTPTVVGWLEN